MTLINKVSGKIFRKYTEVLLLSAAKDKIIEIEVEGNTSVCLLPRKLLESLIIKKRDELLLHKGTSAGTINEENKIKQEVQDVNYET